MAWQFSLQLELWWPVTLIKSLDLICHLTCLDTCDTCWLIRDLPGFPGPGSSRKCQDRWCELTGVLHGGKLGVIHLGLSVTMVPSLGGGVIKDRMEWKGAEKGPKGTKIIPDAYSIIRENAANPFWWSTGVVFPLAKYQPDSHILVMQMMWQLPSWGFSSLWHSNLCLLRQNGLKWYLRNCPTVPPCFRMTLFYF